MTRQAEKDIRSALRQLRGCRGRIAMAYTTAHPASPEVGPLEVMRQQARDLEDGLVALLSGAEESGR